MNLTPNVSAVTIKKDNYDSIVIENDEGTNDVQLKKQKPANLLFYLGTAAVIGIGIWIISKKVEQTIQPL